MPDLFNTNPAGIPPQNRPLTGPANAPAQPVPAQQPAMAPPAMPMDQAQVPAGPPRDPQIVAAISIYALQLSSRNPVEVSAALSGMEAFGQAYKNDVLQAVTQQLQPGEPAMKTLVLMDALVRNGGGAMADKLLPLLQDPDPQVRAEASKAFGRLRGAAPTTAQAPVNAGVPGQPTMPGQAPAAMPGQPPMATMPGQVPPHLTHLVERFKDFRELGDAAIELAQLPTADQVAVATAFFKEPLRELDYEKSYDLITNILAKKVQEPGVLDAMRTLLDKPGLRTEPGARAKMRAASALLHFGTPNDAPLVAKLLATKTFLPLAAEKLLIDQVAQKPDFLKHPSMLPAMIAMVSSDYASTMLAAGNALAKIPNKLARDAIGESPMFKTDIVGAKKQKWMLDFLAAHPGPYSPLTIQYLQRIVAKTSDQELKKKAQELINKKG